VALYTVADGLVTGYVDISDVSNNYHQNSTKSFLVYVADVNNKLAQPPLGPGGIEKCTQQTK